MPKDLYIPHGSDNTTGNTPVGSAFFNFFISHMVQIIRTQTKENVQVTLNFISHMVQIIPPTMSISPYASSNFISHMVQIIHR